IARYQAQEITRTAIASLKVGYNEIDGYYRSHEREHEPGAGQLQAQEDAQERHPVRDDRAAGVRGEGALRPGEGPGAGAATVLAGAGPGGGPDAAAVEHRRRARRGGLPGVA